MLYAAPFITTAVHSQQFSLLFLSEPIRAVQERLKSRRTIDTMHSTYLRTTSNHLLYDIHAFNNLPKHHVSSIQPGRVIIVIPLHTQLLIINCHYYMYSGTSVEQIFCLRLPVKFTGL